MQASVNHFPNTDGIPSTCESHMKLLMTRWDINGVAKFLNL